MSFYSLNSIIRTGGIKPTLWRKEGRNKQLISSDDKNTNAAYNSDQVESHNDLLDNWYRFKNSLLNSRQDAFTAAGRAIMTMEIPLLKNSRCRRYISRNFRLILFRIIAGPIRFVITYPILRLSICLCSTIDNTINLPTKDRPCFFT